MDPSNCEESNAIVSATSSADVPSNSQSTSAGHWYRGAGRAPIALCTRVLVKVLHLDPVILKWPQPRLLFELNSVGPDSFVGELIRLSITWWTKDANLELPIDGVGCGKNAYFLQPEGWGVVNMSEPGVAFTM